ncbi:MAG: 5-methylcytosine-specific restriction endonuclease system specificity protein McrC [Pyrinomonadaceae bacterium]|nr:5-methylcytosine-specific restriction endonuclease system specificity protein McrC [Chloracidobacterium sp.]
MNDSIPIQNIYYLLCYAWNKLDERDTIDVSSINSTELADLFARVLTSGVKHLIRRGFDRDYLAFSEETPRIRGRINFPESIKRNLISRGRPLCEFDELSHDVLHNRILKSTIETLLLSDGLNDDLKMELWETLKWLRDVNPIRLSAQIFRRVQLHRNNNYYRFLLNVCELVFENLLVDESTGHSRFRDFFRDEGQMRALFEEFVRNFYRIKQGRFKVEAPKLYWNLTSSDEQARKFIPEMRTDICLSSDDRQILIDCKFSKSVLSTYRGKESLKPSHLYQMYAYLHHAEKQKGWRNLEGLLLYPVVNNSVSLRFDLNSYPFHIRTIDLNQDWQNIELDLLEIIGTG